MRRSKGFTLIEVLAALIIIGLGMMAVIRAVNQTVNNTDYLRQKTVAHWVAMNKLAEVRLSPTPPSDDETSGDVDLAGTSWHWRMTVKTVDLGAGAPTAMKRIDIKVAPKDAGDASIDTVTGFYSNGIAAGGATVAWDPSPLTAGSSSSASSSSSSSSS